MKKALKVTAIAFLTASMIIPAKIAMSAGEKNNSSQPNADNAKNISQNLDKISITTSLDDAMNSKSLNGFTFTPYDYYYPITAIVGTPIKIRINPIVYYSKYLQVNIEGDNDYKYAIKEADPIPRYLSDDGSMDINSSDIKQNTSDKNSNISSNRDCVTDLSWTPDQVGIFNIVVRYNDIALAKRKVYVNNNYSNTQGYLQLGDPVVSIGENNTTSISTRITDIPKTYSSNPAEIKYVIGEPLMWSKTLRVPVPVNDTNPKDTDYSINEETDNFNFNQGTYQISTFLKGRNSIEYEDAKSINYRKDGLKDLTLTLKMAEPDNNWSNEYTFTAGVKGVTDTKNLQYAFILWDERGYTVVQGYDSNNIYKFTPNCLAPQGNYRIYARVKQISNVNVNLPNSYEAQTYMELPIKDYFRSNDNIKIKNVKIDAYVAKANTKTKDIDYKKHEYKEGTYAISHEMNIIKINATSKSCLQYKAYAIHDGYCYPLCDYSYSNQIQFYPKSSGDYKLIILAKSAISSSEDARKEIKITVTDVNNARN